MWLFVWDLLELELEELELLLEDFEASTFVVIL